MNLIQNYFFVPANNPRYLDKSLELEGIDYRILDFEDSISNKDIKRALGTVKSNKLLDSDWVRIPIETGYKELAHELYDLGLKNIIVPKIRDMQHFETVLKELKKVNSDVKVIILIENALIYFQLERILEKWIQYIYGIGLGSHDFSAITKIQHTADSLFSLRLEISLLASAYEVEPIDIASMNISNEEKYKAEIQSAFDLGYRAKFVLHPSQLQQLIRYQFFSKEEVEDAKHVLSIFKAGEKNNEVVFKYRGNIYEKPHLEQLQNMVKWGNVFYGTDRQIL